MLTRDVIKEADIIKRQLDRGNINIPQLNAFLTQIIADKPRRKPDPIYDFQMENINRGHARKPNKNANR